MPTFYDNYLYPWMRLDTAGFGVNAITSIKEVTLVADHHELSLSFWRSHNIIAVGCATGFHPLVCKDSIG